MNSAQVRQQIHDIISLLVREGLSDHQHFPAVRTAGNQTLITIPNAPNLAASLKGKPYTAIYDELRGSESYHVRMLDGALVQFLFTFENGAISAHRLAFFPSPSLEMYDAVPEYYNADETFADIVGEFSVKFPVRFDFSAAAAEHQDVDHPMSHLTLGQYKGCRIPVTAPLTPFRFMRFILRNFYNPAYYAVDLDAKAPRDKFPGRNHACGKEYPLRNGLAVYLSRDARALPMNLPQHQRAVTPPPSATQR